MRKWILISGTLGAMWMLMVLRIGSLRLAGISNYGGLWLTYHLPWFQYRGIAPSSTFVWMFDLWLVATSAIQWIIAALILRSPKDLKLTHYCCP
jgi:hypothetical protein